MSQRDYEVEDVEESKSQVLHGRNSARSSLRKSDEMCLGLSQSAHNSARKGSSSKSKRSKSKESVRSKSKSKEPARSKSKSKAKQPKVKEEAKAKRSKSKDSARGSKSKAKATGSKKKPAVDKTGDHPKPKKGNTAYTYFNTEKGKEFRAAGSGKETFTLVGAAWGKCTEEDKVPYQKLEAADKKRHDHQVEELKKHGYYKLEDGSKSTDPQNAALFKIKKKKVVKKSGGDDDSLTEEEIESKVVPKRPSSAWVYFNTQKSKELRDAGKGKEAFTLSGQAWANMGEKEKAPYEKMALEDKQRFDTQTAAMATKGYFLLDDGSKSTDAENAGLAKKIKVKKASAATKPAAKSSAKGKKGTKSPASKSPAKQRERSSAKKETSGDKRQSKSGARSQTKSPAKTSKSKTKSGARSSSKASQRSTTK